MITQRYVLGSYLIGLNSSSHNSPLRVHLSPHPPCAKAWGSVDSEDTQGIMNVSPVDVP